MSIKAIGTVYKGYRFRSRLEARWAVFFDALGLNWGYEVEGFTLGGDDYLPDFLIKGGSHYPDIWVEIKPDKVMEKSDTLRYYKIGTEFSESKSNIGFLITRGDPLAAKSILFGSFNDVKRVCDLSDSGFAELFTLLSGEPLENVYEAACAARQARFEHGEKL